MKKTLLLVLVCTAIFSCKGPNTKWKRETAAVKTQMILMDPQSLVVTDSSLNFTMNGETEITYSLYTPRSIVVTKNPEVVQHVVRILDADNRWYSYDYDYLTERYTLSWMYVVIQPAELYGQDFTAHY
jgi:hypothetical protein